MRVEDITIKLSTDGFQIRVRRDDGSDTLVSDSFRCEPAAEVGQILSAVMQQLTGKGSENFELYWNARQLVHCMQMNDTGFSDKPVNFGEAVALIHSELSEALEYDRKGNGESTHIPGFLGVEEELADAVLRIMHLAGRRGLRIAEAVNAKMKFNATRPHKHGGKAY